MDIKKTEKAQTRLTKAIFPKLSYSERLVRLYIYQIGDMRINGGLNYLLQIVKWLIDIDSTDFLLLLY